MTSSSVDAKILQIVVLRSKQHHFLTTDLTGGFTHWNAVGSFESEKTGGIVNEPVAIVETFTNLKEYKEKDLLLKKWIDDKKHLWGQESIAFGFESSISKEQRLLFV